MTRNELEILRLKSQIQALQTLVAMLYNGVVATSPKAVRELRGHFASLRRDHSKIALKGVRAEYSDLVAGEYQEALDDLLRFIERNMDEVDAEHAAARPRSRLASPHERKRPAS